MVEKGEGFVKRKVSNEKRPNFLIFIVDEERFPTAYENEELKKWRKENLKTQELLLQNGMEFRNHYIGSTACSPSRATLYTGQYPSLHGLTKTVGGASELFDHDIFWLDPNTVPTIGDYFRTAGYQTYWKGKWHVSVQDILFPGTHNAMPSYDPTTGVPEPKIEKLYVDANRLDNFGFSGWVGPEPHGTDPHNSASSAGIGTKGRDEVYSREVVNLIHALEEESCQKDAKPWLIVSSFLNPHDIALYGELTKHSPLYNFEIDSSVPVIPPAPTANESLLTKPTAQAIYRDTYPKTFQPTRDSLFYRQLYYSLQKQVDGEMYKVYEALKNSHFYEDTIIIFTSDHGELLGSHGGLFQKWYNAYEESIHVPFIIHNPLLFPKHQMTDMLTSHVDIFPTLLGLAHIDGDNIRKELRKDHSEVRPLVGRDLSRLLLGKTDFLRANEPVYFMTDDDVTRGSNQINFAGKPYNSVSQPNHIETVITYLQTGKNKENELWKLSRYYDNPKFWSDPYVQDQVAEIEVQFPVDISTSISVSKIMTKTEPVPDQFELYNVTLDPYEVENLADPSNVNIETNIIQTIMTKLLEEQSKQKRLTPTSDEFLDPELETTRQDSDD